MFNFHTYDSANFKSIGNNTQENVTCYCAGPAYYRMCSTDVYCLKQTGSSSTKGNHHPSFSPFLELGRRKLSMVLEISKAAQKMLLKQEPANIRKWIARFYYFRHLHLLKRVCIAHNNCMSCPSIWATPSALLINILGFLPVVFVHSDQLSEGEIIPFSGVCQSGGGCIIHAGGGGHALTDRLL